MTASHALDEADTADVLFKEGKYREAFERYRLIAERNSVDAQLRIGWMYQTGNGVGQDLLEARRWYAKAAETDSPIGQFYLGRFCWAQGQNQEAVQWLEKSAAQGYMPALYRLGKMYDMGEGVNKDKEKACRYFQQAADLGHLFARRKIVGSMLRGQYGIMQFFRGLYELVKLLVTAVKLGLVEPDSDRILR